MYYRDRYGDFTPSDVDNDDGEQGVGVGVVRRVVFGRECS